MEDWIGWSLLGLIVVAFFSFLGFVAWSQNDIKARCIDARGTIVGGECVFLSAPVVSQP